MRFSSLAVFTAGPLLGGGRRRGRGERASGISVDDIAAVDALILPGRVVGDMPPP
jgi:hypothetical protein